MLVIVVARLLLVLLLALLRALALMAAVGAVLWLGYLVLEETRSGGASVPILAPDELTPMESLAPE